MNKIINSDALDALRKLPDSCCRTCITSPPYYGLRDYGTDGQIGLENTPDQYIENLVKIFREVRRVLKDDGTLWEMHRGHWGGGKPGMDRVAFMQQYTPMYEREKARDMTPGELTTQIDAVAASLPDKGQKKLADRESDRRKREQYYAALSGWNRREALEAADPLALEVGEVSDT